MNIPELQRNDVRLQTGTAQRAETTSSDALPAVFQSPAQVLDEVETSILSDIRAVIARFGQDLDELAGTVRAAGQGTDSAPLYCVTDDAAPPVRQGDTSSCVPEGPQATGQGATDGMPHLDQAGASRTVLQGVLRVLVSKAQQFINTLAGGRAAAPTGEETAAVSIESAIQTQQLPAAGDASGAGVPPGISGVPSPQGGDVHIRTGPAQIQDGPDRPASTGMGSGIEGEAVLGGVADAAGRMDPAGVMRASLQSTAEAGIADRTPAGEADVFAGTTATVRPGPETIKEVRATIDPASTPPGEPTGRAERTALADSDGSAPLYGRQAARSFGVPYGDDRNASPGNTLLQSQGAGPAAPAATSPGPSPAMVEDMIAARVAAFVEEINAVLSAGQDEAAAQGEGVCASPEAEAQQMAHAGGRTVHGAGGHAAVKQVLADMEGLQGARSIGISVEKNGLLHADARLLSSNLLSSKEETLRAASSFVNTVSDRVDSLANVLAAACMSYSRPPQMGAVRGSEETSSPEQEMTQEQGRLEQRLTELRLLIEKSEFLTKWLQGRVSDDAGFPEDEE